MDRNFEVTFLGTNGSCPYNCGKRQKYGTNTLCVAAKAGDDVIIFDAGTGICGLSELQSYKSSEKHLFLTHYHMDHIDGFLFNPDMFNPKIKMNIYGRGDVQTILETLVAPPVSPVTTEVFEAEIEYRSIEANQTITLPGGSVIKTCLLSHPGGALGCRLEYNNKTLCYCVDVELSNHKNDTVLEEFFRDSDLLILDASFTDGNVIPHWGHSSPSECIEWAIKTNVKKLALYHYGYRMSDDDIDKMQESARTVFPNTFTATDGMSIFL
ncbi:MAG: MBL fold metallo-hydrolase [Oscillospiraceae bacterium]|nr:MBL fold metallo-hydrolase [Oscillospiraceae bacterium]